MDINVVGRIRKLNVVSHGDVGVQAEIVFENT